MTNPESPFRYTHCFPILAVRDLVQAQEYYRDVLGFRAGWRDGVTTGVVENGVITLFMKLHDDPKPTELILSVADADAVHAAIVRRGGEIVEPLATQPWGMREFTVRDLNGHRLTIGHVDESEADYSDFTAADER